MYPLRFRKYGHTTFMEVNVICLVVMYTNKVLRPCHMFMLDNTFWVERLTEKNCLWIGRMEEEATDGQLVLV